MEDYNGIWMEESSPEYNSDRNYAPWADQMKDITKVVQYFLKSGKAVEQGYKSCASLTKLGCVPIADMV